MTHPLLLDLKQKIEELKTLGLFKKEREIISPQGAEIVLQDGKHALNFCANNYLGLANHKAILTATKESLDKTGFGMSSVRFICGTQLQHHQLEKTISKFLKTDDTILYSSCFDANGGLFETILGPEDAVISDELNHASIIDGIRLCKAQRYRYKNNDLNDLRAKLEEAKGAKVCLIATDGVFSMDGTIANLKGICDLAEEYQALVMVDDSHAVGFLGEMGRGSIEYCGVEGRVDIITGTLGKALGGASGGYTSGRQEIIDWLRQRSRPYLFSNTLAPPIVAASLKIFELIENSHDLRDRLRDNSRLFREGLTSLGFNLIPGDHPIIPIMIGDAKLASQLADELLKEGVYVIGFSYPVVPQNKARIRTQMSAAHTKEQIEKALLAFKKVGKQLKIIP